MLANDRGLDFEKIRHAVSFEYPRASDLPGAGFAAGPCLFKDAMQLSAAFDNKFLLGHAAMLVNEGLPLYLVSKMAEKFDLSSLKIGILGMAFKGESDDIRSSLSYKLKKALQTRCEEVFTSDPYVSQSTDPKLVSTEELISESDVIVIGAPHKVYKNIRFDKPVIDVWNLIGNGVII
jgi:UDP-N-acetyl-D-mannosaminuronic acid dehydrogenase